MMSARTIVTGALALGLSTFASLASAAPPPDRSVRLGLYGGIHMALDEWDLDEPQGKLGEPPLMGGILGLRFGGEPTRWLGLELDVGVVLHPSGSDELNTALRITGDALLYPFDAAIAPFVKVGAGVYTNVGGDRGSDTDFEAHYGLGLRAMLSESMALRVDVMHVLTDAYDPKDSLASNLIATVGVDFYLLYDRDEPTDRDGDGVLDRDDRCPDAAGPASNRGCPLDSDGDGILDTDDRCPDAAGPASNNGCPEAPIDAEVPPHTVVRFGVNRDEVSSKRDLEAMLGYLRRHPGARLSIEGHTDSQGDAEYNQGLSVRRANSVKQAFVDAGIDASRITARGYGQTRPVAGNDTEEGRALNRRVEVSLLR